VIELPRMLKWSAAEQKGGPALPLDREWLVTNGLGGYASGTVGGAPTRRFHGLLVASLPAPLGRRMMLDYLGEELKLRPGIGVRFGGKTQTRQHSDYPGSESLTEFHLDAGLPVWLYQVRSVTVEKQILLPHLQNTVYINYRLLSGDEPVQLELRPAMHFRPHEGPLGKPVASSYALTILGCHYEVSAGAQFPSLRMVMYGDDTALIVESGTIDEIFYPVEAGRGYDHEGMLWSPGYFRVSLELGRVATLVASTESWDTILALGPDEAIAAERHRRRKLLAMAPPRAQTGPAADLVLAADQFIIVPAGRQQDTARARAAGNEVRTVIAGYHWFTDWGRDTMISLEGLTLATGRYAEAGWILRTFAYYIRDGLIPNVFPEGEKEGLYHTGDATLWFFHALDRYLEFAEDDDMLKWILPKLVTIVDYHLRGTKFGIVADPKDGLLCQGADGYQLTWMDAKVDGWVVTPRRGKAVEINALWYNALRLLEKWMREERGNEASRPFAERAMQVHQNFNQRFWYEPGGYLYDVVDGELGDDSACRPNQLLAISLPYPVLDSQRWQEVLQVVRRSLLTPNGLRSLAPDHPDYKPRYDGDVRARDAAYHQGTVWPWLIGPFIDAWLKTYPEDRVGARHCLEGLNRHLSEGCIGSIGEIFDSQEPFVPRGCVAQAWSVA
jgi:predicted glycogen debranching enzyme